MNKKNFLSSFLLVLALFLASGTTAFGFSEDFSQITSEKSATFNPDRNTKSFFLEETSFSQSFQTSSEDPFSSLHFLNLIENDVRFSRHTFSASVGTPYFQDKRKLLGQFLFPFHFFW